MRPTPSPYTDSPYTDLDRPPLAQAALNRALVAPGGLWREIRVLAETVSTNADVVAAARGGAAEGLVVVAEAQTAGRGRLGRSWVAPPRSGLTFSVLLRPGDVPAARWVWLPLLAGLATAQAVRRLTELDVRLKWPNDLLVAATGSERAGSERAGSERAGSERPGSERKVAGILVERVEDAAVVGIGLNATTRAGELPVAGATSLALAGATTTDRDPLLRVVLRELASAYLSWREAGGDAEACGLRSAYRDRCTTLGAQVRVELPGGGRLAGEASDVDSSGRLVVHGPDGTVAVGAGDVIHVR